MKRIERDTRQQEPVRHEVERLAGQLERALSDPAADTETFFHDVDQIARASSFLHGSDETDESLTPGSNLRRSVLVVDDNPSTLALIGYIVEDESGLEVVTAQGFDEAFRLATERVFDACLLDINLGEVRTGEDLLHAIQTLPTYRKVPILAFSAYNFDRAHFLEAGFTAYLEKPFKTETLVEVLGSL